MQLVLILKQLMRLRVVLAVGAVFAGAVAFYATHSLAPAKVSWTARGAVFVDSGSSAIANSTVALDALGQRAGVYANMMTSTAVLDYVARASGIPVGEIAVTGPVGTTGIRQTRPPSAPGGPYGLELDVTAPQPIINVSALAPTHDSAIALANGAAQGLAQYVSQLVADQKIGLLREVSVRQLGTPIAIPLRSGVSSVFILPIYLVVFCGWCMLVLFVRRFVEAWRTNDALPVAAGRLAPTPDAAAAAALISSLEDRFLDDQAGPLASRASGSTETTWFDHGAGSDDSDDSRKRLRLWTRNADRKSEVRMNSRSEQLAPDVERTAAAPILLDDPHSLDEAAPAASNGNGHGETSGPGWT